MKRREFLKHSVLATSWMAGWPSRRPTARARLRLGYAAITWSGNDRQAIDDIAALGYRGIQLRQSAVDTWGNRPAELQQLLSDRTLTLVALSSGNVSLDPAAEQIILARHARNARFVRDAGGRYLQVIDERPRGREPTADDFRRMGGLLTEIGRRSADVGIPLGYHNHMGALGQSPEEVTRVLDAADPHFVKLLLDTAHYQQAGGNPAQAVREHAGRLLFLHIKDLDRSNKFVELGRGQIDFPKVFAALDDIGFDGWGMVELDSPPDATRTPKDCARLSRHYLETLGRWTDAS